MLSRNWTKTQNGLAANISPYSWATPGHELKLNITLLATGQTGSASGDKLFIDANETDALELMKRVQVRQCANCGKPFLGNRCPVCSPSESSCLH